MKYKLWLSVFLSTLSGKAISLPHPPLSLQQSLRPTVITQADKTTRREESQHDLEEVFGHVVVKVVEESDNTKILSQSESNTLSYVDQSNTHYSLFFVIFFMKH